jgi:hypothetical protein
MTSFTLRLLHFLRRTLVDFVSKPASPRPLAALRIGLAAVLLLQAYAFAGNLLDLYGERGIVQWEALPFQPPPEVPTLTAARDLLAPLGVGADSSVRLIFYVYVASLVLLLAGWQTRFAALVAWLAHMALKTTGSTSIYGVDDFAHIALFYCIWMPVGFAWSLDRYNGSVSDAPTPLARLALRVLQLHLCIVYLSSGVEKATGEQWWNGEAIWRSVMRPDLAVFDLSWLAGLPVLAMVLCWGTLMVEVGYVLMIWHRRTRLPWAAATMGLHLGIAVFLGLWSFGLLMMVLNVAALVVSPEPRLLPAAKPQRQGKASALASVAAS